MPQSILQMLLTTSCLPRQPELPRLILPEILQEAAGIDLKPAHHKAANHNLRKAFVPS